MDKVLVLLSGGLDSTAALIWALKRGGDVRALSVYYGQPAGIRECERAIAATRELGVEFYRSDISSAYYGGLPGLFRPSPSGLMGDVDSAFVPMRNPILLSVAAARALLIWPRSHVRLVVGFNAGDCAGFPDCSPLFVEAFSHAINSGLGESEHVTVDVPWANLSKRDVVSWVLSNAPERTRLIDASWSCYRDSGPCGECTACVTRTRSFDGQ